MNVVYSSDENFVPYLEISIMSLLKINREEFDKIHIYILDNGIKGGSSELLRNLSDESIELSFIFS